MREERECGGEGKRESESEMGSEREERRGDEVRRRAREGKGYSARTQL